jgi:hypothetical protein
MWVGRYGVDRVFPARASEVARRRGLSLLEEPLIPGGQGWDPKLIDSSLGAYERGLPGAIDALIQDELEPLDPVVWLAKLVPFVAGLFVRGEEFGGNSFCQSRLGLRECRQRPIVS